MKALGKTGRGAGEGSNALGCGDGQCACESVQVFRVRWSYVTGVTYTVCVCKSVSVHMFMCLWAISQVFIEHLLWSTGHRERQWGCNSK